MTARITTEMATAVPLRSVPAEGIGPTEPDAGPAGEGPRYSLRRFLAGSGLVLAIAALAWPFVPRLYEATATLVLRPTDLEGQANYAEAMHRPLDESSILSDLDSLRSTRLAERVIAANALAEDPEFARTGGFLSFLHGGSDAGALRERVADRLVLARDRQSYTITAGFRSADPAKAKRLTDSLVAAYLDLQMERKAASATALNRLLSDRAAEAERRAGQSAAAMKAFLERTGLIDDGEGLSLQGQLETLSTELATTRARLIEAGTRADTLERLQARNGLDAAPEVVASPVIQRLNQSLTESTSRVTVLSSETRAILRDIEAERTRIVESARIEADNWSTRAASLSRAIDAIRAEMVTRRAQALDLDRLRRDADTDARVLADAQTRLKTLAPDPAAIRPDAEILSPAILPDRPVLPSPPLYALGALLTALLAGALLNAAALRRDVERMVQR